MKTTNTIAAEPFWATFHEDMERYYAYCDGRITFRTRASIFVEHQALWAVCAYRFGRMAKTRRLPIIGPVLWILYRLLEAPVRAVTGVILHPDARIGPGLYVGHFGGIYVGPGVVMGRTCNIGQTCFIGASGDEDRPGAPVLGDRVYVGVGAKVVGQVTVGDGAAIGANAVVLNDLPPSATAVGNPASIINYNGSAKLIRG